MNSINFEAFQISNQKSINQTSWYSNMTFFELIRGDFFIVNIHLEFTFDGIQFSFSCGFVE